MSAVSAIARSVCRRKFAAAAAAAAAVENRSALRRRRRQLRFGAPTSNFLGI